VREREKAKKKGRSGWKTDNGKERNTQREKKKTLEAQHWEEKERRCAVRLFGTNSLKEGAV
jgi:hypothetical protein